MTANQINFAALQENRRHNVVSEGETERHNKASEEETQRHNFVSEREQHYSTSVSEEHYQRSDAINDAHYTRMDAETARSHLAGEAISQGQLDESIRHNQVSERLTLQSNQVNRMNAYTRENELAETARHNVVSETLLPSQIQLNESNVAKNETQTAGLSIDNDWKALGYATDIAVQQATKDRIVAETALTREKTTYQQIENKWQKAKNIAGVVESYSRSVANVINATDKVISNVGKITKTLNAAVQLAN